MKKPFRQGWLDSLCGIYSIVNCDKIINGSNERDSQNLFDDIIKYLHMQNKLKDIVIGGVYNKDMISLLDNFSKEKFKWKPSGTGFKNINEYWSFLFSFFSSYEKSCVILSIGGIDNHLTVSYSISEKKINLFDSSGYNSIMKSRCKIYPYLKEDKFVIYPSQSFICWKEQK